MHVFVRIIGGRVLHHRDFVAEFCGVTDSRLYARMGDEADGDQLMDAVFLEQQIQVCVGEATRAPVLLCNNFTR